MIYSAKFYGEEMTVHYTARGVESYRPDMVEIDDVGVYCMEILGVGVDFDKLPGTLQDAILELSNEVDFYPEI
jgi:hypothetical protein